MRSDAKRAAREAKKRKQREQRVQQEKARRRRQQAEQNRSAGRALADLPIEECVISKGWKKRGLAHILLTRRTPEGSLLVGGYFVDIFCLGLKDTALLPNVAPEEYAENVRPNIFNDPVELQRCDPGVARGIVEGAIAFAGQFGFRPNKRWAESKRVFAGIEPTDPGISFGKKDRPCLVIREGESLPGAVRRLERLGEGNYAIVREGTE